MGLSRRKFTKEFKLAAVRRLEQGISMAEASRALEVSAPLLRILPDRGTEYCGHRRTS